MDGWMDGVRRGCRGDDGLRAIQDVFLAADIARFTHPTRYTTQS